MKYKTFDKLKNGIGFMLAAGAASYCRFESENGFLSGNVPDVCYPIVAYTSFRLGEKKPSLPCAMIIAGIYAASEFAQYIGLCPGTFDPKDIPMYFIGAGIAYGIDKMTYDSKKADLEERLIA